MSAAGRLASFSHAQPRRRRRSAATGRGRLRRLLLEHLEERVLLAAGDLDPTFGGDGKVTTNLSDVSENNEARDVAVVQADGKIVVVGNTNDDYSPTLTRYQSDGALDAGFGAGGKVRVQFPSQEFRAEAIALPGDGKIVIVGNVYRYPTGSDFVLARFNSDGSVDTTFGEQGFAVTDFGAERDDYGTSVAVDSAGRIVIAGYSYQSGPGTDFALARYNPDGSLDAAFGAGGLVLTDFGSNSDYGHGVAIDGDGKIVAAGYSYQSGTGADFALARYASDGSLDTSFGTDGLVATDFGSSSDYGNSVALDGAGKIVVAGYSYQSVTGSDFALARYSSDGSLDAAFGTDGLVTTDFGMAGSDYGNSVAIGGDGTIVVAGSSYQSGSGDDFALARYNPDGSLDATFGTDGLVTTSFAAGYDEEGNSVAIDSDGKIVVVGSTYRGLTGRDIAVVRYERDGSLDGGFGNDGLVTTDFAGVGSDDIGTDLIVVQPDNKILSVSTSYDDDYWSRAEITLARRHADGSLDASFGNGGRVSVRFGSAYGWATAIALQSDGKIVVAGSSYQDGTGDDFALARFNPDGSPDTSFGDQGRVATDLGTLSDDYAASVAMDSDGKIVVAGYSYQSGSGSDFALARYNSDGSLDTTFGTDGLVTTDFGAEGYGDEYGSSVAIDSGGKIVVAGYSYQSGTGSDFALARYNSDGSLDATFGTDGLVTTDFGTSGSDYGNSVAIDSGGKIVVAGSSWQSGSGDHSALARYNADGSLDATFGTDGLVTTDFGSGSYGSYYGRGVAIDSDGTIVVAGSSYQSGTGSDFALARYNRDGSLDAAFGGQGLVTTDFGSSDDVGCSVAIDSSGKIVVLGYSEQLGTGADVALARFERDGALDATFGDGGKLLENLGFLGTLDFGWDLAVVQPDGKIVVAGTASRSYEYDYDYGGGSALALARYHEDGSLDPTFGAAGVTIVDFGGYAGRGNAVALQPDGKIVVAGVSFDDDAAADFAVARLTADGMLDRTFGGDGTVTVDLGSDADLANGVAVDGQGRIVAVGVSDQGDTGYDVALVRFHPDGRLDDSFGSEGVVTADLGTFEEFAADVAIDGDGKILVAGSIGERAEAGAGENFTGSDFLLARFQSDGSLDTSFGAGGVATADFDSSEDYGRSLALDATGKIVVAGTAVEWGFAVTRFQGDGTVDGGFGTGGQAVTGFGSGRGDARSVVIDQRGRIVVAGSTGFPNAGPWDFDEYWWYPWDWRWDDSDFALTRYDPDGRLDPAFGQEGKVTTDFGYGPDSAQGVTLDGRGRIVAAGFSWQGLSGLDLALARYDSEVTLHVVQQAPPGRTLGPVASLSLDFSLAIDPDSFSLADVVSFSGPAGPVAITWFQWRDANTLEIAFEPQTAVGDYELVIGPDILAISGEAMNQDGDQTAGETPDDQYAAIWTIVDEPPRVVSHAPTGMVLSPFSALTLVFNEPMDPAGFAPADDLPVFTGPAGAVNVDEFQWQDDRTLEIRFPTQTAPGEYQVVVGPQILDLAGNALDQDRDLLPGESPDDRYTFSFRLDDPPRIGAHAPSGAVPGPVDRLRIDFSKPMAPGSFAIADDIASFTGPAGPIAVTGSSWLAADSLELTFGPQSGWGYYQLVVTSGILDLIGVPLDQDGDGNPGEADDDRYVASFELAAGPYVADHAPRGDQTDPVAEVTVTFNEPIDAATFTAADVQIQGPAGTIAPSGNPTHVDGNTYRIAFPQQTQYGEYHVFVGPHIQNGRGQEMDQDRDGVVGEGVEDRYDAAFAIIDVVGPRVTGHAPALPVRSPWSYFDVTFCEPILAASFGTDDVVITGPAGPLAASGVEPLAPDRFRVHVAAQTAEGVYHITVGPNVQDLALNWMDQDEDGLKQEPSDQYEAVVTIDDTPPHATGHSLTGVQHAAVRSFEVTFSEGIDPATFGPASVTVTGPLGSRQATQVEPLAGDRFRVTVPGVEADGTYGVVIAPTLADWAGNLLPDPYQFAFTQQLPDLAVTAGVYPVECVPGQQIEVQWTVTNAGQGTAAGGWSDRVSLAANEQGSDAVELARLDFGGPLPAGESYTRVATVTVPAGAPGSRWVVVTADSQATLDEVGGENNTRVLAPPLLVTARPYPDLRVTQVTAPSTLDAGESMMVSWTVQNAGSGATTAGWWFDALYLSADATLGASDVLLTKVRNVDFLGPGESYVQSQEIVVPDSVPLGAYYLIAATDVDKTVQEFDRENNNATATDQTLEVVTPPPPFLSVTDVRISGVLEPGDRPTLTWTVTNTGGTTISTGWAGNGWDDGLALSRDPVYQEDQDYWLGSHTYWYGLPLRPGQSYTLTGTAEHVMPAWEPGTYYVIVIPDTHWGAGSGFGQSTIDRDYGVAEVRLEYSVPDLAPVSLSGPAAAVVGQSLRVDWRVENNGPGGTRASTWSDSVYLSTDDSLDAQDTLLGTLAHNGALSAGTGYNASATAFTVPAGVRAGTYRLILQADAASSVPEGNEANNVLVSAATITVSRVAADLQIVSALGPAAGVAGESVRVDWTVVNGGPDPTPAGGWSDAVYLSDSATFDPATARLLREFPYSGVLGSQETYSRSELVPLPQRTEGTFHLFLVLDSRRQVFELDGEDNNVQAAGPAIEIADRQPDLQVASFAAPATAVAGQPVAVDWQIGNIGAAAAWPAWQDAVYLSQDDVLGPEDGAPLLTVARQDALAPGETYAPFGAPVSVSLPDGIEGTYYLILAADAGQSVYEKGLEDNNLAKRAIQIVDLVADLQVQSATADAAGKAGEFITLAYTAVNQGQEAAQGPWQDAVYLSADDRLDPSTDRLIGLLDYAGPLGVGETYRPRAVPTYVRLPDRIEGQFHLLIVVDQSGTVPEKAGEANNVYLVPQAITVTLAPADLRAAGVQSPGAATAGALVNIAWTVTNEGPQATAEQTWRDGVYLSGDAVFEPAGDIELGIVTRSGALLSGESYTGNQLFQLRQDLEGPYYVYVVCDVRNQVYEHRGEDNNVAAAANLLAVTGQRADLQIASLDAPDSAVAGDPVVIGWTVANRGPDATPASAWSDSVYLSADGVLDASDTLLGTFPHNGRLPSGGSYAQSRAVSLPAGVAGELHVIVKTDSGSKNDVFEYQAENNNTATAGVDVSLAPPADLQVTRVAAPATAWSGQNLHVEWTVTNAGGTPAAAKEGGWFDSVYLSRDAYLDPATDLHLGAVLHSGPLAPDGDSYPGLLDARLPAGISGPYYVFVAADTTNRVVERDAEGNNASTAPSLLQVNLTPPADLVPTRLAPPLSAFSGEPAVWEYDVANQGTLDAVGSWYDSLYLSADAAWDIDDVRIARVYHEGDLAHGDLYTQTVTADTPAVVPGNYYLIVRTDILDQVRESAQDEANNTAASVGRVAVDCRELPLDAAPVGGQLRTGAARYYKIPGVAAGGNLVVNLDVAADGAASELYVGYGTPPARSEYDFASLQRSQADQRVVVPATRGGTYYVLVYGDRVSGDFTEYSLRAQLADFSVYDTNYGRGGTAGNLTIEINGAGFDRTVTASLTDGADFQLPASQHYYVDGTRLYATFDLTGAAPGVYDVVVRNGEGAVASVVQGLEVVAGGGGTNRPEIDVPALVRWGREFSFTVTWGNDGLNDALAPLLTVGGNQPFGFAPGDRSAGTRYTFLGTSTDGGPAGILRPGGRETMTFFSLADPNVGAFQFFVDREFKDTAAAFDWDSAISVVQPAAMTDQDVGLVIEFFHTTYGANNGGFLRMLSAAATAAWEEPRSPQRLLQDEVLRGWSRVASGVWGIVDSLQQPEGGFVVTVTESAAGVPFVTHTDRLGRFHVADLPNGSFLFSVEGQVIDPPGGNAVDLADGQSVGPVTLSLSPARTFSVQIDMLDGEPVKNASVSLLEDSELIATALTDDAGRAHFSGVAPGTYVLVVQLSGGGLRQYEGFVVPTEQSEQIEINLASATIRGMLPSRAELYPVLVSTAGSLQVLHAVISGDAFGLHATAGEYRFLVFDSRGEQVEDLGLFSLDHGAVIDVGLVGADTPLAMSSLMSAPTNPLVPQAAGKVVWFDDPEVGLGVHMVDGPPSALAIIDITVIGLGNPDLVETLLAPFVIWGTAKVRGAEYAEVVEEFVAGGAYEYFTDGSQTIEQGGGVNPGFRKHPQTDVWLNSLLTEAAQSLQQRISSGELKVECGDSQTFDLSDPRVIRADNAWARSLLYQDGNMAGRWLTFGNTLAGGVGHYGTPPSYTSTPDWRRVDAGKVRLSRNSSGHYTVQLEGVKLHVRDAFDFWPGSLGTPWLTRYGTTILAFLEINRRAADVVFDAVWTDREIRKLPLGMLGDPCDPCKGPNPPDSCGGGGGGGSHDPNDKLGPEGYDVFAFIRPDAVMPYTVRFENDPTATASAVLVTITDQLDSDDDWSTFQLGTMQFGDHVIPVPPGLTYFETRIDLRPDGNNLLVDVVGRFDPATGLAEWSFTGIDPATGELTDDPLAGFLPPNNPDVHDGEGFVQYTVFPKQGLPTGTQITNVATIVFDWNEPIDTPLIKNTIDAGSPTSAVDALPALVSDVRFPVSWAGADDAEGSGIRSYDIYVSVDDGPYQQWLRETAAVGAVFVGEFGRSYAFYSIARDNVGHVEPAPPTPDAVTRTPAGTASIGDRAWLDADADGTQDAGEPGLAEIVVRLHAADGAQIGVTATDAAGYYRFDGLDTAAEYYLAFAAPDGYRFSPRDQGADEERDSDVEPLTGRTDVFAVTAGEHLRWDAGLFRPVEIRGVLWNDVNGNGRQDEAEMVMAGWTVFLDGNANGSLDDGELSLVTGDDGAYRFSGLAPGQYAIGEIMPERWDQTYPGPGGMDDEPQGQLPLQFAAAQVVPAGGVGIQALAYSVPVLVDWNNDGRDDLLVGEQVGSYGKIRLYLNEGSAVQPQFGAVTFLQLDGADLTVPAAGCLGVFARVADWNADGRKDLLLGLSDGRVRVLLNANTDEAPEFTAGFDVEAGPAGAAAEIDVGSRATVQMVDWNADGRADLVLGAMDGRVRVYLNEGSAAAPEFRTEWIVQDAAGDLTVPGGRSSVAVADLDGDGRLDLVLGNSEGQLFLYRNVGSPQVPRFETGQRLQADGVAINLGTARSRPFVHDFDGDGLTDIIVGGADGLVRVYLRQPAPDTTPMAPLGGTAGLLSEPSVARPFAHTVRLVSGELRPDVDFGNHFRNKAPTVKKPAADQAAMENARFQFTPDEDAFADEDPEDVLSYTAMLADGSPLPDWLSFDGGTLRFQGRPGFLDEGVLSILLRAHDQGIPPLAAEMTFTIVVQENPAPWRNPDNRWDVDASGLPGEPYPLDVLTTINVINDRGNIALPQPPSPSGPPPYVDVDGDGWLLPLDVLQLINFINFRAGAGAVGGGESEPPSTEPPFAASPPFAFPQDFPRDIPATPWDGAASVHRLERPAPDGAELETVVPEAETRPSRLPPTGVDVRRRQELAPFRFELEEVLTEIADDVFQRWSQVR